MWYKVEVSTLIRDRFLICACNESEAKSKAYENAKEMTKLQDVIEIDVKIKEEGISDE